MLTGFKINSSSEVSNTVLLGLPDQSFTVSLGLPGCIFYMDNSCEVNKNQSVYFRETATDYSVWSAHDSGVLIQALNEGKTKKNPKRNRIYSSEEM